MYSVIVIEDEDWVYEDLKSSIIWENYGFHLTAHIKQPSLAEAVIKKMRPDLIITDIMMPKMNGLELIQRIRKIVPDTNIVIFSAYSEFEYAKTAMAQGVINYLVKPLDEKELICTLQKVKHKIENTVAEDSVQYLGIKTVLTEMYNDILYRYYEKLKINDYAKKYHFNPNYLSRVFKNEYGKSFIDLLLETRIEKAKELLVNAEFKIVDISTTVGYDDYAHFSKIFKEYTGISPREFREKNQSCR